MSVIVTVWLKGEPKNLEQHASSERDAMQTILNSAKPHGVIAHRFYGSDDGQVMVIDEWPDRESFQRFFQEQGERIQPLMQEAGFTSEPEITFWTKLETGDDIGW